MEPSCSLLEETAMDIAVTPARTKSKTALNRRPSGYWKVFSNWWRGRYAALKTRPTVNEVIEWYHRNAATSWPAGQVPCLKAVLRQSKGLRPIDGLKEYFREYRKKRKQQGGLALKAGEDAAQRRARPAKRRRGRAAHKDSSDEDDVDELEQEASVFSDQHSSDEEEVEVAPPRRQRAADGPSRRSGATAAAAVAHDDEDDEDAVAEALPEGASSFAAPAAVEYGAEGSCRGLGPVQAMFDAWHVPPGGAAAAVALALEDCPPGGAVMPADLACVGPVLDGPEAAILLAAGGDPVHPAVAQGMVPIASGGSPRASAPHPSVFAPCPAAGSPTSFTYIARQAARRSPSTTRVAVVRRGGATRLSLPPLVGCTGALTAGGLSRAAPAADAPGRSTPEVKAEPVPKPCGVLRDDHAGDRCSTGGGVPVPCDSRFTRPYMHERLFDAYGFEYVAFGPPAPYGCHPPHPSCYRSAPYPVGYSYRAMSSASYPPGPDGSTGGGATSSFSPAAPWPVASAADGSASYPQRHGSVESKSQLDGCFPHHPHALHPQHHHHTAWLPWAPPTDGGAPWQAGPPPSMPPYVHDAAWGRGPGHPAAPPLAPCSYVPIPAGAGPMGCPCGSCPDSTVRFHCASGACPHPQGMRPVYYVPRHCMAAYPGGPPEMWAAMAVARSDAPEAPAERETCSSSVSDHDGQEHGRWSPCSGTSGQASQQPAKPCMSPTAVPHWPHQHHPFAMLHGHPMPGVGCYPAGVYPVARGLATAGSVTSMASLAPMPEESPFMSAAVACRSGSGGLPIGGFATGVVRCGSAPMEAAAPTSAAAGCDADVSPYLADAPSSVVEAASSEGAAPAEADAAEGSPLQPAAATGARAELHGSAGLEGADCGLGLADGFEPVVRDAMDHDLAFAFENFVSCDAGFEALACQ